MSLGDDIVILETTSTEVKNRILKSHELLRAIDTGALYIGGKDGKPQALIASSTTPDGGMAISGTMASNSFSVPYVLSFPDFLPSIVASFVAGATASQAGTTVTVTAAAHGIVGNTSRNGQRIYFPGSATIPAGWYSGFAWVDANTITFTRATSATVESESVNGGAPFLATVLVSSLSLPGLLLGSSGRMTMRCMRHGDATSGAKAVRLACGAVTLGTAFTTTAPAIYQSISTVLASTGRQLGISAADGIGGSAQVVSSIDTTVSQVFSCTASVTNASQWLAVDYLELEVLPR